MTKRPISLPTNQPLDCTNRKLRQPMRRMNQFYDAEMARAGRCTASARC